MGGAVLLLIGFFPGRTPLRAETGSDAAGSAVVEIERIDVGIGGHFKVGCRTPILVTFRGDPADPLQLAVWVPDPDGNLTKQPSAALTFFGGGPHKIASVFRTGRMDGVIRVDLELSGHVLATHTIRTAAEGQAETAPVFPPDSLSAQYWLVLGGGDGFLRAAEQINPPSRTSEGRRVTTITLADTSDLPTQPGGLDCVDVLAINAPVALSEAADAAIREWVEQGGHLVLSVNSGEAWNAMPLSAWVPIRDVGTSRLRDLDALRGQFPRSALLRASAVSALRFDLEYGRTVASTLNGPLWARLPVKFGRVTLLGLDLAARPLNTWDTLPQLCERLADSHGASGEKRQGQRSAQLARTGVSDLSTQLAAAIDQFPQIEGTSNWATMGWMIVYLLVIGPLDYLLVHRLLRRPHLTWITFPLLILASAGLAASTARESHAPGMVSNQVAVIDFDAESGALRTHHWSSFVSPETRRHAVEVAFHAWWTDPDAANGVGSSPMATRLGWTGLPENGFRGMYRTGGLDLAKPRYHFDADLASIEDVPVGIWSSFSTTASQHTAAADPAQVFGSSLEGVGGQLYGTISNRLHLPIEDWFIAYYNLVYFPRSPPESAGSPPFAAGQTVAIPDNRIGVRTARSYLTGVTNIRLKRGGSNQDSDAATRDAYDPLSRDFDRIVRAISFYQSSGGKEYTTLDNDALQRLDLSPLLDLSRAVLYGRIAASPAQLLIDGEPIAPAESETYIRVLLPVQPRE